MKPTPILAACSLLLLAAACCFWHGDASACAPAPPRNTPVAIASETAVIVWDEKSQTQHFIRRASFATEAKDFGFLVPTPTKPTLAEADDQAFAELARITAPRVIEKPRPSGGGCDVGCAGPKSALDKADRGVEVLEENSVSGFDYAVLRASDADELSKWLEKNGYDHSPQLKEWAGHYVEQKWIITAFKVAKPDSASRAVSTKAVRMSFQTPKPFFPYREPKAKEGEDSKQGRMLRTFVVSTSKMKGTLGEDKAWPGKVAWANKVAEADREKVVKLLGLPADTPPASWWLTEFEDASSPRPGTADVFFGPAADNDPVEREPHVKYVAAKFPDCVASYALAVYVVFPGMLRWLGRRRSGKR